MGKINQQKASLKNEKRRSSQVNEKGRNRAQESTLKSPKAWQEVCSIALSMEKKMSDLATITVKLDIASASPAAQFKQTRKSVNAQDVENSSTGIGTVFHELIEVSNDAKISWEHDEIIVRNVQMINEHVGELTNCLKQMENNQTSHREKKNESMKDSILSALSRYVAATNVKKERMEVVEKELRGLSISLEEAKCETEEWKKEISRSEVYRDEMRADSKLQIESMTSLNRRMEEMKEESKEALVRVKKMKLKDTAVMHFTEPQEFYACFRWKKCADILAKIIRNYQGDIAIVAAEEQRDVDVAEKKLLEMIKADQKMEKLVQDIKDGNFAEAFILSQNGEEIGFEWQISSCGLIENSADSVVYL